MKKIVYTIISLFAVAAASAQARFPQPDFHSGYEYPNVYMPVANQALWQVMDIALLVALMSLVAWAVIKKRTRKPIIWTSIISVAYFGFFRNGCVCSVGSVQNVTLALADSTYILPISVLLLFILPIIFAFLFGRVFCAGVCPLGALQELVNVKNYRLSKAVTTVLGVIPWLYLIFALLFAVTRTSFIICQYDPFVGIFRLGGSIGLITFGVLLLIASIFTGRPFCRFICPYGALLSLFSRVSIWKIKLTSKECINCELCHDACPVDAIKPPYDNKVKEDRLIGVKRIINYFVILPLMVVACAFLMRSVSEKLANANKDVRLYKEVIAFEANPTNTLTLELEAFYKNEGNVEELIALHEKIQSEFKLYSTIAGGLIGLVLGITLIGLSLKRKRETYEIEDAECVACAKCFSYCPQNMDGGINSLIAKK
ncbi:MAG: 4Fe-4S binding protein [Dysgonamonadaceae bacterium]|jgi:ferredoxin|nr:4Fe-4S binding protein [Dysgonamonadaceae bacterium]